MQKKGGLPLGILDGIVEWIAEQVMNILDRDYEKKSVNKILL